MFGKRQLLKGDTMHARPLAWQLFIGADIAVVILHYTKYYEHEKIITFKDPE